MPAESCLEVVGQDLAVDIERRLVTLPCFNDPSLVEPEVSKVVHASERRSISIFLIKYAGSYFTYIAYLSESVP